MYWIGVLLIIALIVWIARLTLFAPLHIDGRKADAEVERQLEEMGNESK